MGSLVPIDNNVSILEAVFTAKHFFEVLLVSYVIPLLCWCCLLGPMVPFDVVKRWNKAFWTFILFVSRGLFRTLDTNTESNINPVVLTPAKCRDEIAVLLFNIYLCCEQCTVGALTCIKMNIHLARKREKNTFICLTTFKWLLSHWHAFVDTLFFPP